MSLNRVVINDNPVLMWDVSDMDMHALINWLNEYGKKVTTPVEPAEEEEENVDLGNIIHELEESDAEEDEVQDFTITSSSTNAIMTTGDVVIRGILYCNNIRSLDQFHKEEERNEDTNSNGDDYKSESEILKNAIGQSKRNKSKEETDAEDFKVNRKSTIPNL